MTSVRVTHSLRCAVRLIFLLLLINIRALSNPQSLDLKRGGNKRYQKTAAYGHFGRQDDDFTWERVVKL